ncbi:MutS protein msh4 [Cichlidogyrus casuarinus]|uniref:CCR4-NOT transcription complex subunit 11 n=1 Tax=Cichlidogyrus casuarinus TaxID=1844966 RepID=A0ABD2QCN7_9PLAT
MNGTLKPRFLRVPPPMMPLVMPTLYEPIERTFDLNDPDFDPFKNSLHVPMLEETIWLNPLTIEHEFHFDSTLGCFTTDSELKQLLELAYTSTLNINHQRTLARAIEEDPDALRELAQEPSEFSKLVDNNSLIAIEVLKQFVETNKIDDYLASLAEMEVTLNLMEVVNRLALLMQLPIEFTRVFVNKCINACYSIEDKYMKGRLVRMVCLLFQALIRNNNALQENENLLSEILNFSTEYTDTQTGSSLYKMLRTLENTKRPNSKPLPK